MPGRTVVEITKVDPYNVTPVGECKMCEVEIESDDTHYKCGTSEGDEVIICETCYENLETVLDAFDIRLEVTS